MSALLTEAATARRLHLPKKVLGDNFYPFMYGKYRGERITAMAVARTQKGEWRAAYVRTARKMNHEALWYLRRIEARSQP
jgi:hypothetical protein